MSKRKEKGPPKDKIINDRGEITTNTTEIQTIMKEYYENYIPENWGIWEKWKIPRNLQTKKTETGRNRKFEQIYNKQRD